MLTTFFLRKGIIMNSKIDDKIFKIVARIAGMLFCIFSCASLFVCFLNTVDNLAIRESENYGGTLKSEAWVASQQLVESRLKSPGTANWGEMFDQNFGEQVQVLGDDKYQVHGWVDSQNSFGAVVRTNFSLTIKHTYGDWVLVEEPTMIQR